MELEKVLEVNDLTKLYKNGRGVKNISFTIKKGDIVGLLGPNGSGKTTIMKVILGLSRANEGSIKIFGNCVEDNPEKTLRKVGALIEKPAIFEYLSAKDNLKMMARFYEYVDDERIEHVLNITRISQYKREKVSKFSLGMKQRLGLALAILSDPQLLLLDEPINGLDIEGTVEIREMIKKMAKEKGISFLIASHLASEIEKTCNKVVIIHEGELLSFNTMEEALKLNPSLEDYFLSTVKEKRGSFLI